MGVRRLIEIAAESHHRGDPRPDAPLLSRTHGRGGWRLSAWDPNRLRLEWLRHLGDHGIDLRPPKIARHTLITLLLEAGAHPIAVQSITHPGSLPREWADQRRGAFGRYIHPTDAARLEAMSCLALPVAAIDADRQLSLWEAP